MAHKVTKDVLAEIKVPEYIWNGKHEFYEQSPIGIFAPIAGAADMGIEELKSLPDLVFTVTTVISNEDGIRDKMMDSFSKMTLASAWSSLKAMPGKMFDDWIGNYDKGGDHALHQGGKDVVQVGMMLWGAGHISNIIDAIDDLPKAMSEFFKNLSDDLQEKLTKFAKDNKENSALTEKLMNEISNNKDFRDALSKDAGLVDSWKNLDDNGRKIWVDNIDIVKKNRETRNLLKEKKFNEAVQKWGGEMLEPIEHRGVKYATRPDDPSALDKAIDITNRVDDLPKITDNLANKLGLSASAKDKLAQQIAEMKEHFWKKEHLVEVEQGKFRVGRFTRESEDIKLWEAAENGFENVEQVEDFKKLLAHEYIESKLMKEGLPYRGMDKSNWDEFLGNVPNPSSYGAHDLAPKFNEIGGGRFGHWQSRMGKIIPNDLVIKDDLSNLDELVDIIKSIDAIN